MQVKNCYLPCWISSVEAKEQLEVLSPWWEDMHRPRPKSGLPLMSHQSAKTPLTKPPHSLVFFKHIQVSDSSSMSCCTLFFPCHLDCLLVFLSTDKLQFSLQSVNNSWTVLQSMWTGGGCIYELASWQIPASSSSLCLWMLHESVGQSLGQADKTTWGVGHTIKKAQCEMWTKSWPLRPSPASLVLALCTHSLLLWLGPASKLEAFCGNLCVGVKLVAFCSCLRQQGLLFRLQHKEMDTPTCTHNGLIILQFIKVLHSLKTMPNHEQYTNNLAWKWAILFWKNSNLTVKICTTCPMTCLKSVNCDAISLLAWEQMSTPPPPQHDQPSKMREQT